MEANEADARLFDYVLQRSRTRESSILAVATIATSASLVLLGLFLQAQITVAGTYATSDNDLLNRYKPWIESIGIMFAVFGITYRRVTARTIHQNDEDWLNSFIRALRERCPNTIGQQIIGLREVREGHHIEDPIGYCRRNRERELLIRSLLVIPLIAWGIITYSTPHVAFWECIIDISIGSFAIGFSGFIMGDRLPRKHD